jgi:hypothetical protein
MSRLSREIKLKPLLKLVDNSQWVTEILAGLHICSTFEKDRTLMLGFSNCSYQDTRSNYHILLNHHHFKLSPGPLEVSLQLHHHHHLSLGLLKVTLQLHHRHHLSPSLLEVTLQLHLHHNLFPGSLEVTLQVHHHHHLSPCPLKVTVALRH